MSTSTICTSLFLVGAFAMGCGGDDDQGAPLTCVEDLPADCSAGFNPTWPNVYANVVRQSCGGTGTGASCHAAEGKQGGLELSSSAIALSSLLGELDGRARVVPGDPECSILMERLESDDPVLLMPYKGTKLQDPTRCAVQKWIEMGAAP